MTLDTQTTPEVEKKPNDKEYNFRALEAKYQNQLNQAVQERERLAKEIDDLKRGRPTDEDSEDESEPYVDHKKLNKKLAKFAVQNNQQTKSDIDQAVQKAIYEERKRSYLDRNPDFYQILQENADKLMQKDPELAETILSMPEGFERQKLVYNNIKALGLHKPPEKVNTMQQQLDSNRRKNFYQPSNSPTPPFAQGGDFSQTGMKTAFEKMQELKKNLRLG